MLETLILPRLPQPRQINRRSAWLRLLQNSLARMAPLTVADRCA